MSISGPDGDLRQRSIRKNMRAIMRLLGFLAVVGGFVALVIDVTLFMANDVWSFTTLRGALDAIAPGASLRFGGEASDLAGVWAGSILNGALSAPASLTGLIAGLILMLLFRKRTDDDMR